MKAAPVTFLLALLLFRPICSVAQTDSETKKNDLSIDALLITRGEFRYGGISDEYIGDNGKKHAAFIFERVRINAEYSHKGLSLRISPQHQAIWGMSGNGQFGLYEGWVQYRSRHGLFLKVGRQELTYDDQRIIGADNWTMLASSHDVLKLGYEGNRHQVHGILAFNQNGEKISGGTFYENGSEFYKSMETLWYHFDGGKVPVGVSLLFMNIGMQQGDEEDYTTQNQQLWGGYARYKPGPFNIELSYYRQTGHEEHGLEISAWMTAVKTDFAIDSKWKLTAGYEYLSGDTDFNVPTLNFFGLARHDVVNGFNPLFGAHHKFYGAMDFFYVQNYYGSFTPGLQNAYAGFSFTPGPKLGISLKYHYFATAAKLEGISKTLGHEIETTLSWNINDVLSMSASYTYMHGSEAMRHLRHASDQSNLSWAWLSLVAKPRFFSTKW